jgi:hypothetical protein
MLSNQSFTYNHFYFLNHFLSSLILVGILGACSNNPETKSTISPISTQQSSQLPAATLMESNPGPLPTDNNSGGINLTQDSLIPPIPPGHFAVVSTQDCPELNWQGTGSDIIVSYKIYRRQINTEIWNLIATVPMRGDNRGSYTFCDKKIEDPFSLYEYAISAQDHYGNESDLSEPRAVE